MKKNLFVIFSILVSVVVGMGCSMEKTFSVKYEVLTSSNDVTINYIDENGVSQTTNQTLFPWTKSFNRTTNFDVSLQAIDNGWSNPITATVYVGGNVYKTGTGATALSGTIKKDN